MLFICIVTLNAFVVIYGVYNNKLLKNLTCVAKSQMRLSGFFCNLIPAKEKGKIISLQIKLLSMKYLITFCSFLIISLPAYCQTRTSNIVGKYASLGLITALELNADSTFSLSTPDCIFTYTYQTYRTKGTWTASGDTVRLNPEKKKRMPRLHLTERTIEGSDSVAIKINYSVETYRNDSLAGEQAADFRMMTVSLNSRHNYRNIVRHPVRRICAFAPRVRRQVIVDSSNIVRFPKGKVHWIAINTYGFDGAIQLPVANPASNYLEVNIVQPVDEERTPRNKMVIIKGNKAYYYEFKGKVPTSGWFLEPLERQRG